MNLMQQFHAELIRLQASVSINQLKYIHIYRTKRRLHIIIKKSFPIRDSITRQSHTARYMHPVPIIYSSHHTEFTLNIQY